MKVVRNIAIAALLGYGLYEGAKYLSAQNQLNKAGDDPAVLQAVALHDALTGQKGKLLGLLANTTPAGNLLQSFFAATSNTQVLVQQILDQIQDLDAVRKVYQKMYFTNLDAALVKALGTGGAATILTAEAGKKDNPNQTPTGDGNTFVPKAQAVPYPIGPGMKSSIFAVARKEEIYLYQEPASTKGGGLLQDRRIYEKGSWWTPLVLKKGDQAGYATGVAEKDPNGVIWLQVGKRTLNPTSTWWVKKSEVDLFSDYASAKAKYPKINKTQLVKVGLDLLEGLPPRLQRVKTTHSTAIYGATGEVVDTVAPNRVLGDFIATSTDDQGQAWILVEATHSNKSRCRFVVAARTVQIF